MTFLALAVLAVVQGITEFLPISSSAHLILVPVVTGWPDQGVLLDVAVHVGTLGAVTAYWRRDVGTLFGGFFDILRHPRRRPVPGDSPHLFLCLVVATVPVVVAGGLLALADAMDALRNAALIGWTSIIFGLALYWADRRYPREREMGDITLGGAFVVGLAQMLALFPGTSRSGITMTAARMLGFTRPDAARFSMLLSIPTILAAGLLAALSIAEAHDAGLVWNALLAALLAFGAALAAIALLMRWLQHAGFLPFVIYRIGLGVILLSWAYG